MPMEDFSGTFCFTQDVRAQACPRPYWELKQKAKSGKAAPLDKGGGGGKALPYDVNR